MVSCTYRARLDIDIYPSTHRDPTSPLCSLHHTPHPAGQLSSVHERDRDRRRRCRATLLPLPPRGQPVRYDQDNVLSVSLAPYVFTKNGPLTRSSIASAPLETTCKNSHHGGALSRDEVPPGGKCTLFAATHSRRHSYSLRLLIVEEYSV
jgi:hypothetical protein